ncbi:uncharacterized protein N7469_006334 [Penicillium citrinum]|uniref:Exocyst complex component Sec3 PIP2-binding N-terminal domain-containing protein n=1 Tax=Penicillium citrinum TaxID=5077 RepID=A0A9W9NY27_PENCI|nr:uncharacterized protein N7469_006334 [Penicillium citrinum]KAJ5231746.1 hypothetical protein N7469_006334 [Penicillium citrinum]
MLSHEQCLHLVDLSELIIAGPSVNESYITHVRITEDGTHPSTPAPPNAPPENKKPRVIIVSVRKSGRVRMHKARENNDGSFSIGKTWMLDDLSSIQSYTAFVPRSPVEQQHKEWAGNLGFLVTVGKPYYWHARSSKEKEFFIGSLVKIYKKYTGGKVPNLIGFDERERQLLSGSAPAGSSGSPVPPPSRGAPGPSPDTAPPAQQPSAYTAYDPSRDPSREARRKPDLDQLPLRLDLRIHRLQSPPPQRAEPKTFLETEERNSSVHEETRPPSSRSGQASMPAPPPIETKQLDSQRSTDGLRPTTPASYTAETRGAAPSPGSSIGQKSPYREVGKSSTLDQPPQQPQQPPAQSLPQDVSPMTRADESQQAAAPEPDRAPSPPLLDPAVAAAVVAADEAPTPASAPVTAPAQETSKEPPSEASPDKAQEDDEAHRPGLGPMIKKKSAKDIAGAFRKAANMHGAFKPRPGGAGERLLAAAKKQQGQALGPEPDGITGVVPAPFLSRSANDSPRSPVDDGPERDPSTTASAPALIPEPETIPPAVEPPSMAETPTVEVTDHATEEARALPLPREDSKDSLGETGLVTPRSRTPSPAGQGRRRRRRQDHTLKYCEALKIEPTVLDERGIDFDEILTDLGWNGRLSDEQKIEDLEADVRREIGRVEATSWLGNLEQQEGKVEQLAVLIDKTIEECEELDGLLTLYSHELNTLNDDVSYIEAQSQGLQVQTANQKLLQSELQNLLKTLSISSNEMRPLKEASLSNLDGLKDTENALSILYKAMLMIDADIGQNKQRQADASVGVYANTEIGQMRAIKQKKEEYRSTAMAFLQRLKQFMSLAFKLAEQKRTETMSSVSRDPLKLDNAARQAGRGEIWMYNPLMLFAREVSTHDWQGLLHLYEQQSKSSYQNEFRDNNLAWKRTARKPTGDEQELLFTHQEKEKEGEGITMAARKLTVRRGKTVRAAAGLRLGSGEKKVASGKVEPCEAFAGTLRETLGMITEEQNFVVQFFHLDSLATTEYSDLIASQSPENRQCPDLSAKQSHDPDRAMAKRVEQIMDELYSFWPNDIQSMVDWALQADPMQGIGILFAIETAMADLDDTNQEFIIHSLQKLHTRLMGLFNRFVDDQIRGIEDTKVKINKRKGVISFMRVFPHFSTAVENMLAQPSGDFCDIRISVNDAYERINRAMWESLKFIAKEAPGQPPGVSAGAGDPEDKEILNYHILLIENMNHYAEEVEVHNLPVLQRWVDKAHQDFAEHMKLYLDAVIHRPLGKLLDFISSIETIQANGSAADVASRTSHSRAVAKKVLSSYDSKEIKRGIEMLKKRVEKHFGDADDPGLSRSLVIKVLRECEERYEDAWDRTRQIIDTVYEGQLELEWRKEDSAAMFRK